MGFFARLLLILLVIAVSAQGAALYWGYQQHMQLKARVAELESQSADLQARAQALSNTIKKMEQDSVGAMVKKANQVIVQGWDAIINSVEAEMDRAREALEHLDDEPATGGQAAPQTQPAP
ncbi:hypothetical protein [Gilvimarinus sp. DA14]|uniref:hypothetical protein n=1 Tax=Gilvimarinus sp. DA14 TaxID=2956798 RepID=UPI0020B7C9B4|nr:hypothetical protein [Gilvimarinus sp. DA14]UTF60457.1 hypothetical protein NHM04_01285 [Gilvimarinus sp. DA14]